MDRYICIHGHFYQPPRENPWLGAVEFEDSAYPFHDWNTRISAECYAPNAASRILDDEDRIVQIVNNYARISFNFGPTLLAWMEREDRETYRAVLEADRESQRLYGGHGSALAQAYNHLILPLANRRDRITQVVWGIRDFEHRFLRRPEGMWLPETAVDLETLEILVDHDIRFTILAPNQASRVMPRRGRRWRDVSGSRIDPTTAYEARLPSGRSIVIFFYDGPVARSVAFDDTLRSGETLAERLLGIFNESRKWPQLAHIATDGETYGHHHRFGDMALAYALRHLETSGAGVLTNYAAFLERHPPTHQVEIFESSSWSCVHGVDRWQRDCGCNSGGRPGWNQAWRAPLRTTLDWLRDRVAPIYEQRAGPLLADPWAARDDYVEVLLDSRAEARNRFLRRHALRALTSDERADAWRLLELQRCAMLMYTSCGWFFDDVSSIETVQVLKYASRCLHLAGDVSGVDLEPEFLERLAAAPSNLAEFDNGRGVYLESVKPSMVDLHKVAAHYGVSLLFHPVEAEARVYDFRIALEDCTLQEKGKARLAVGRIRVASVVIEEEAVVNFGVLHFGDHNLTGGVQEFRGESAYREMAKSVIDAFTTADLPDALRELDRQFGKLAYSLRSLFRDERRKIVDRILRSPLKEAEAEYMQIYRHHAPMMQFLTENSIPLPKALKAAGEVVLNAGLETALDSRKPDLDAIVKLLDQARQKHLELDAAGLGYAFGNRMREAMCRFHDSPEDLDLLHDLERMARIARAAPFDVDFGTVQNRYYALLNRTGPEFMRRADDGEENARRWIVLFTALGKTLKIRVK